MYMCIDMQCCNWMYYTVYTYMCTAYANRHEHTHVYEYMERCTCTLCFSILPHQFTDCYYTASLIDALAKTVMPKVAVATTPAGCVYVCCVWVCLSVCLSVCECGYVCVPCGYVCACDDLPSKHT